MNVTIETLRIHRDERGSVVEPLDAAQIARQRNVHVVLTEPGHVRGNHYHRRRTERLVVHGPALVRFGEREGEARRDVDVLDGEVTRFTIPPGISHAILNTGTRTSLLISFNDHEHDPTDPDTLPDLLIEPGTPHR